MPSASPSEAKRIWALRQQQLDTQQQREQKAQNAIDAILAARQKVADAVQEFQLACAQFQRVTRQASSGPAGTQHNVFVTLQQRLGGVLVQTLKRAEQGDRIIHRAQAQQEEERALLERQRLRDERRAAEQEVAQSLLPRHDDFEVLYSDYVEDGI